MIPALNMELEIVRTVLQNEVNDIYVCTDLLKDSGTFYTMISISDAKYRKIVTEKLNTDRLFFANQDFIGSFVYQSHLNLVFRYTHESLLSELGGVYMESFVECKQAAIRLVSACAELGCSPDVGLLLLENQNININREEEIQFNYFLDFAKLDFMAKETDFVHQVAEKAFGILELNYRGRYDSPDDYPSDLRLFYLKMKSGGFGSLGLIISTIRELADKPEEQKGFFWFFINRFRRIRGFFFRNSMTAFLTILVIVTIIYAAVQLYNRAKVRKAYENNISYNGIEYIGDVYLGNEE